MVKFLTRLFFDSSLIKIAAVILVFYFALYRYDASPDAISKRFNKEVVSKDFQDVKKQTKKIFDVLAYKKSLEVPKVAKVSNKMASGSNRSLKQRSVMLKNHIANIDDLESRFIRKSENEKVRVDCGDVAVFSYELIDRKSKKSVFSKNNRSITVSQQEVILFERSLVGVAKDEIKEVSIDKDHNFLPSIVRKYFLASPDGIAIKLTLNNLTKADSEEFDSLTGMEKLFCN